MRWFLRATAATLFMFGVYLASAVVSLDRLVDAARIGNGAAILERTNLERLRHSFGGSSRLRLPHTNGAEPARQTA